MGKSRGRPKLPHSSVKMVENLKHSTGSFCCEFCPKTFRSPTTLQRHLNLHPEANQAEDSIEEPKFICPKCSKSFSKKSNLEKHMASHVDVSDELVISENVTHHDLYPFECTECWVCFSQKSDLLSHQKNHKSTKSTKSFKCTQCDSSFSYRAGLNRHVLTHAPKPYLCKFCGATFDDVNARSKHAKDHLIWCNMCKSSFKRLDDLCDHILDIHKIKTLPSDQNISAEFADENSSESGENKMDCEKSISGSTGVGKLLRKSTVMSLRQQKSSSCKGGYSKSDGNELGETNAFKCQKCETGFENKVSLEQHSKNCAFYYMCGSPSCKNVTFSSSEALSHHVAEKHKISKQEKTAQDQSQVEANESGSSVPNNPPFNFTESGTVLNSSMIQGTAFIPSTNQMNVVNPAVGVGPGNVFSPAVGVGGTALVQGIASNAGKLEFQVYNKPGTYEFSSQMLSNCLQSPQSIVPSQVINPLVSTGFTPRYIDPATAYMGFNGECFIPWFQTFCEMCKSLKYPLEFSLYEKIHHCVGYLSLLVGHPLNRVKEQKNYNILLELYQELQKILNGHIQYVSKNQINALK